MTNLRSSPPQLERHQRRDHHRAADGLHAGNPLAQKHRAADRCDQRLQIHEQRGAKRPHPRRREITQLDIVIGKVEKEGALFLLRIYLVREGEALPKKGRKTFSRGVWAPAATIDLMRAELDAERSTDKYAKRKEADARRRDKAQAEYVEDFFGAVVEIGW